MGFDNQLGAVERTLQAKIKDYEELLLLSGDANHAREVGCSLRDRVGVPKDSMESSSDDMERGETKMCGVAASPPHCVFVGNPNA